jgi:DNA-binding NtrC family response regulator
MNVLHLDDDLSEHQLLRVKLKKIRPHWNLFSFSSVHNAELHLERNRVDIAFIDQHLGPRGETGSQVIARWKTSHPDLLMILFSSSRKMEDVLSAWRAGALDYLPKGEMAPLEQRLTKWEKQLQDHSLLLHLRERNRTWSLVGSGDWFSRLQKEIKRFGPKDVPVHIIGESGTGKELIAKALHWNRSPEAPFLALNCAGIPESLAESILFGHERGAFTGADRERAGVFEEAGEGTVFLDEINSLPLTVQAKLLRVLQEREVRRVGGLKAISLGYRLLTAANRPLEKEVRGGRFREDLFHRIQVLQICIPPLRERKDDISLLLRQFYPQRRYADSVLKKLEAYDWPGNVRELQNVLARAEALADPGEEIGVEHLPTHLQWKGAMWKGRKGLWKNRTRELEREMLQLEYEREHGNLSRIALALGLDRSNLYRKLVQFEIHRPRKKG